MIESLVRWLNKNVDNDEKCSRRRWLKGLCSTIFMQFFLIGLGTSLQSAFIVIHSITHRFQLSLTHSLSHLVSQFNLFFSCWFNLNRVSSRGHSTKEFTTRTSLIQTQFSIFRIHTSINFYNQHIHFTIIYMWMCALCLLSFMQLKTRYTSNVNKMIDVTALLW